MFIAKLILLGLISVVGIYLLIGVMYAVNQSRYEAKKALLDRGQITIGEVLLMTMLSFLIILGWAADTDSLEDLELPFLNIAIYKG